MMPSLLLALAAAAPAPSDAAEAVARPLAGVALVAPDGKAMYVPGRTGGIDALDPATGKELWHNADASYLALATADRVVGWLPDAALSRRFTVAVVDAATGHTVAASGPIDLPEWAAAGPATGRTFEAAARMEDGRIAFVWHAESKYWGGIPPPTVDFGRNRATGKVTVDPKTGRAVPEKEYKAVDDDFATAPPGGRNAEAAGLTFAVGTMPVPDPKAGPTRALVASKDGTRVWTRPLRELPFFPPPPTVPGGR